jgi:hypothetical protein
VVPLAVPLDCAASVGNCAQQFYHVAPADALDVAIAPPRQYVVVQVPSRISDIRRRLLTSLQVCDVESAHAGDSIGRAFYRSLNDGLRGGRVLTCPDEELRFRCLLPGFLQVESRIAIFEGQPALLAAEPIEQRPGPPFRPLVDRASNAQGKPRESTIEVIDALAWRSLQPLNRRIRQPHCWHIRHSLGNPGNTNPRYRLLPLVHNPPPQGQFSTIPAVIGLRVLMCLSLLWCSAGQQTADGRSGSWQPLKQAVHSSGTPVGCRALGSGAGNNSQGQVYSVVNAEEGCVMEVSELLRWVGPANAGGLIARLGRFRFVFPLASSGYCAVHWLTPIASPSTYFRRAGFRRDAAVAVAWLSDRFSHLRRCEPHRQNKAPASRVTRRCHIIQSSSHLSSCTT